MLEFILEADKQLFLALNGFHAVGLDSFMLFLTAELTWLPLYALLLWLAYQKLKWRKAGILLVGIALVIALADQTTSSLMKPYFKRLRPSHEPALATLVHTAKDAKGNAYKGGKYGFASSHAANTYALALFFFLALGRQGRLKWLFAWATLVSYTRIYLGVHYPLDVLCGALVGLFWAWVAYRLLKRFLVVSVS